MPYETHLDGVRAISIILVITNHIAGSPLLFMGGVGVDIFFALSGWLITRLLVTEDNRKGRVSLAGFYVRRIFRILPLYVFTIALYALIAFLVLIVRHDPQRWEEFKAGLPYMLTFNMELIPSSVRGVFGQAWTLGIEEKFYLVWPIAFVLVGAKNRVRAIMIVAGLCLLGLPFFFMSPIYRAYTALAFACGTAVVVSDDETAWRRRLSDKPGLFLTLAILAYLSFLGPYPQLSSCAVGLCSALLIASLHFNPTSWIARGLAFPPLAFAGRLTFGIYLMHVIVINLVEGLNAKLGLDIWVLTFGLTYVASIAAALVLRVSIEQPMITLGRRLSRRLEARREARTLMAAPRPERSTPSAL